MRLAFWRRDREEKEATAATVTPLGLAGQPQYVSHNFENYVREGYRKNELIYTCISKTANSAAQIKIRLRDKRTGEVIEDHPLLRLLERPNPDTSQYEFLYGVMVIQRLAGHAYFEIERDRRGLPIALWGLRPDWVRVVPGPRGPISTYEYRIPGVRPIQLEKAQVLDFPLFDPLSEYIKTPPIAVAARVAQVDNAATDFVKLFFERGGIPPGVLVTKGKLRQGEPEQIQERWIQRYGGWRKWIAPAVLDSDADYKRIGFTFQELGFEALDNRNEVRICMVFDIPPIIVGAGKGLDKATYSNYETAEKAWWQNTLLPNYEGILDTFRGLKSYFPDGDRLKLELDKDSVYALQDKAQELWERNLNAFKAGSITVNELRGELGKPDLGPAGEVYLRPLTIVETPAKTPAKALDSAFMGGGANHRIEVVQPALLLPPAKALPSGAENKNQPHDAVVRERRERSLLRATNTYLTGLKERLLDASRPYAKQMLPSDPFWNDEKRAMMSLLLPIYIKATRDAVQGGLELLGIDIEAEFGLSNEAVRQWAEKYTFDQVAGITETSAKLYQATFIEWLGQELPLSDLELALQQIVGEARARAIATTEITRLFAEGNLLAWKASGVVQKKQWQTSVDELVCPICAPLAGIIVDLSGAFPDIESSSGPPAHVNCRCWLRPVVEES